MILINFKAYTEGMGIKGLEIAKVCDKVSRDTGIRIAVAPQLCDLALISGKVDIPVYAQHVDAIEAGPRTGWSPPEAIKIAGAAGTLLNHSEHPMKFNDIEFVVKRGRELELETCICVSDIETTSISAALGPDYIAIEPPELIGGKKSVVDSDPQVVKSVLKSVRKVDFNVKVLCGAGIDDASDVAKALSLGTEGVLIASGIVKARYVEETLRSMAKEFMKRRN